MEGILETRGATKRYGSVVALDGVDIVVRRGDIFGLVGDNGAGKSTLFKLICGLIYPTEGEIRLFGEQGRAELERQRSRMGAIIEQPGFFPALSVEKNLESCRIRKGVPGKESVGTLLELVGLEHAKGRLCRDLSMGMKQRLGMAMALLGEPELLLLDEPTSGLDPSGIVEMRTLLKRLNDERGITIVISSHNLPELEQLATVYGFLNRGRLIEQIGAKQLLERCGDSIEISVSDAERYVMLLETELAHDRFLVLPDGTVRIFDPKLGSEAYGRLASERGMDVYRLERKQSSLEQYYLEMREQEVRR